MCNKAAIATRYDLRNYTANRYRHAASYQVIKMVHNGLVKSPIKSLDEIRLRDKNGDLITQKWLDDIINLMNGHGRLTDPENPTGVKFSGKNLQENIPKYD